MSVKTAVKKRSFYPLPHEFNAIGGDRLSLILRPIEGEIKLHRVIPDKENKQTKVWGYRLKNGNWQDLTCDGLGRIAAECPLGKVGDRLIVKETWSTYERLSTNEFEYLYKSDYPKFSEGNWKSPATMPRDAARWALDNTGVRVMRLQDVTEGMAFRWGVPEKVCAHPNVVKNSCDDCMNTGLAGVSHADFELLWNAANPDRHFDSNPWIWAIAVNRVLL